MDNGQIVSAVCMYIESHVRKEISYGKLSRAVGLSYRRIREVFEMRYGMSLARYILTRRLNNAAFTMSHTGRSLTDIAFEYGFNEYNTFSRAFKRVFGITPADFKKSGYTAGRGLLTAGVYAPIISCEQHNAGYNREENAFMTTERILLGVPRLDFNNQKVECTAFSIALKNCLNYMGQQIEYPFLTAACGAAFSLRWNLSQWDEGQLDIQFTFEDPYKVFIRAFHAAGRSFKMLKRKESDKEAFKTFIKNEIDAGRPVIALGVVGPPEACIIAGYRDHGDTLLGWSFFQRHAEFKKGISFHENGYFITSCWWENKNTVLLMAVGEEQSAVADDVEILQTAIEVMAHGNFISADREKSEIACGQAAYEAWANRIDDDANFAPNQLLPLLKAKYTCHQDGQIMVGAGRLNAIVYIKSVGERHPEAAGLCNQAAESLEKTVSAVAWEMHPLMGQDKKGVSHEKKLAFFAARETRTDLVGLIRKAQHFDCETKKILERIVQRLSPIN